MDNNNFNSRPLKNNSDTRGGTIANRSATNRPASNGNISQGASQSTNAKAYNDRANNVSARPTSVNGYRPSSNNFDSAKPTSRSGVNNYSASSNNNYRTSSNSDYSNNTQASCYNTSASRQVASKKSLLKPILIVSLCLVLVVSGVVGGLLLTNNKGGVLGVPQGLRTGEKASSIVWDEVANASSYKLRLDGNTVESKTTKAEKDQYEVGSNTNKKDLTNSDIDDKLTLGRTYTVDVKSVGQGAYKDSDYGGSIKYKKEANPGATQLAQPKQVRVEDKALLWTKVKFAVKYQINITGTTIELPVTNDNNYDLNGLGYGSWSLSVTAIGDGETYSNSPKSATVEYTNQKPEATQLATPQGVTISSDNKSLQWNSVPNADGYRVYEVTNQASPVVLFNLSGNTATTQVLSSLSQGQYKLSVKAISNNNNYKDSEFSATVEYTNQRPEAEQLATPQGVAISSDNKSLKWNSVPNADGYRVYEVTNSSSPEMLFNLSGNTSTTQNLTVLPDGKYKLSVKATSNNNNYKDSELSAVVDYSSTPEPPPPEGGKLSAPVLTIDQTSGTANWTKVNNAYSYRLKIENPAVMYNAHYWIIGVNVLSFNIGIELANEQPGAYNVAIQALGNKDGEFATPDGKWESSDFSAPAQQFFIYNLNGTKEKPPINLHIDQLNGKDRLKWEWIAGTEQTSPGGYHYDFGHGVGFCWVNYAEFDGLPPGELELKVRALPGNSETATKQPSDWVVLVYNNTTEQLATPQPRLEESNYLLKWDAIDKASQYKIDINGVSYITLAPSTQFDLTVLTEPKTYTIKMRSEDTKATHYSSSNWSQEIIYAPTVLPLPKPIAYISGNTLSWFEIPNASSFEIQIEKDTITVAKGSTSYSLANITKEGTYVIKMRAIGQGSYINSAWCDDLEYLYTGKAPLTGPTSPDGAVARFESMGMKQMYDSMFAHRFGLQIWKDDSEAQSYYKDDADRNARTDFYKYENFVAAIHNLASKKLEVYDRKGLQYWRSSRITMIDKLTDQKTVIQRGNGEIDQEWNQDKEPITKIVDFGEFLLSPTNNENDNKRELAAFLANISHETNGGFRGVNTPGGIDGQERFTYGLFWNEELDFINATSSFYQDMSIDTAYPPVPGHSYHGRGPIQITWNYNYGPFSWIVFNDKNVLLQNPELVAKDGSLGFMGAIWFWMMPDHPKASCHEIIHNLWTALPDRPQDNQYMPYKNSFALTVVIINGGFEAGKDETYPQLADRIGYFKTYASRIGANITGEKLDTKGMTPWQ